MVINHKDTHLEKNRKFQKNGYQPEEQIKLAIINLE